MELILATIEQDSMNRTFKKLILYLKKHIMFIVQLFIHNIISSRIMWIKM